LEWGKKVCVERFAVVPQLVLYLPAQRREDDAPSTPVRGMSLPLNEPSPLKQDEHGTQGVWVGSTSTDQFLLRDMILLRQKGQQHELVCRHPELSEMGVGTPV
jgi:hypothetical protein